MFSPARFRISKDFSWALVKWCGALLGQNTCVICGRQLCEMTKCLLNEGRREADLRFAGFIVVLLIAISLSCGFQSTFSSSESRVQAAKFIRRNYLCAATTCVHMYWFVVGRPIQKWSQNICGFLFICKVF